MVHGVPSSVVSVTADVYMNCVHDIIIIIIIIIIAAAAFGEHEATGDWRRMRNEELHDLYYSPNTVKSKRLRLAARVVRMGGEERCIQGFGGET